MKISVAREELKAALEACSKVVNVKAQREELRCVRVEARAGRATVSATNLEEWATVSLDGAAVEHEGVCIADLGELRAFIKDAQSRRYVEIESDGLAVKAATDINGSSIARGIRAEKQDDWPEFPKAPAQEQDGYQRRQHIDQASPKQLKYLLDLAKTAGLTPSSIAAKAGARSVDELTRQQCSKLIDSLGSRKAA